MSDRPVPTREQLLHALYEAAELEHTLMCTYLYAAFSLKSGETEGLTPEQASAVSRWRSAILRVATEEMGHLAAIWNMTSALGGSPRFGRDNFPLSPGLLPAGVVVKLAPFREDVVQHFIHLERPLSSQEPDGAGFAPEFRYERGSPQPRLTPMAVDYETVGAFYATLADNLRAFSDHVSESAAFCGDPLLQLSSNEVALTGAQPVLCLKTALAALNAIVEQGEGAPEHTEDSHFHRFVAIRSELRALRASDPSFEPAYPAATNPVLRRPLRPEGRVWVENELAARTVDLANSGYQLMLRLIAYSYAVPRNSPEKALAVDLSVALMRAVTWLGEHAARLPAGPSHPECHAGMSFTTLRDSAPLPAGPSARRFFVESLTNLSQATRALASESADERTTRAAAQLEDLVRRASRGFARVLPQVPSPASPPAQEPEKPAPETAVVDGVETVEGDKLTLLFESKKCIHARFCVTGAPKVFLANVQGPWIHPDAMDVEGLVAIAHACPSGAIRYRRKDARPDETAPPVNLLSVREAGPYAVRANLLLDGDFVAHRATLCRCGASKNKPYCDGSHHEVAFSATGEPPTTLAEMLPERDGPLDVTPETDGPLAVRGNLEIISGTGRVVARVTHARLCRCGGSSTKPFCDGTHAKIGFKST